MSYAHPVTIRYNDLDPQGHVNNTAYLIYLEEARINFIKSLGLWKGSFPDLGIIVADIHVAYKLPVLYGQAMWVSVSVSKVGNKSILLEHTFTDEQGTIFATAEVVLVTFDFHTGQSIPVPDEWRQVLHAQTQSGAGRPTGKPT